MATGKIVSCIYCEGTVLIKKGTTSKKDGRIFMCKCCGKRFSCSFDDLRGTAYALTEEERKAFISKNATNTPAPAIKKPSTSSSGKTSTITTRSNEDDEKITIAGNTYEEKNIKRDANGNLLLRIGPNGLPSPIGASYQDLMNIVNSRSNCTLELGSDGIFILKVVTTTKG